MTTVLFPFNVPFAQLVSIEKLHEAAPVVAGHIEAGNNLSLQRVLSGLRIREWNYPAAVEQFAFALSFHHPLDPSKVRHAKEVLFREEYAPGIFIQLALSSFVESIHAKVASAIHEGRVPSAEELYQEGLRAVLMVGNSPLLDETNRDALIDEVNSLAEIFSTVLPDFLKSSEAANPRENRSELLMRKVRERHPDLRGQERLIKAIADLILPRTAK